MVTVRDVLADDGRTVRCYDTAGEGAVATVVWHHGSPHSGALAPPLLAMAEARRIRLVTYARPSYGGSSPLRGRDVASAAGDVAAVADALGVDRFGVMGASGGGPHALASAALLPGRVTAAVSLAGLAPFTGDDAWFAGMNDDRALRAAVAGREARERYAERDEFDTETFTAADWAALEGPWAALNEDAATANAAGPEGLVDDDLAFVAPWGFDLTDVNVPVLVVHGGQDRMVPPAHADLLLAGCPPAELWRRPREGHVSVLGAVPVAMDWLLGVAGVR